MPAMNQGTMTKIGNWAWGVCFRNVMSYPKDGTRRRITNAFRQPRSKPCHDAHLQPLGQLAVFPSPTEVMIEPLWTAHKAKAR